MYAAYQSHQLCGGATVSNESWCSAVSCSRSAREATFMSVLSFPSGQPGRELFGAAAGVIGVTRRWVGEARASHRPRSGGALAHLADIDTASDAIVPAGVDVDTAREAIVP